MNKKHDRYLMRTYPEVFAQRLHRGPVILPMQFGFEVGDGWFKIIKDVCKTSRKIRKKYGFYIEAVQTKEKFGTLRFYYILREDETFDPELDDCVTLSTPSQSVLAANRRENRVQKANHLADEAIKRAAALSAKTCEVCGSKGGSCVKFGWVKTLCFACARADGYTKGKE